MLREPSKAEAAGGDLVAIVGGNAIRGPRATGPPCGRRDLVGAPAVQMFDLDDHPTYWSRPPTWSSRIAWAASPARGAICN